MCYQWFRLSSQLRICAQFLVPGFQHFSTKQFVGQSILAQVSSNSINLVNVCYKGSISTVRNECQSKNELLWFCLTSQKRLDIQLQKQLVLQILNRVSSSDNHYFNFSEKKRMIAKPLAYSLYSQHKEQRGSLLMSQL